MSSRIYASTDVLRDNCLNPYPFPYQVACQNSIPEVEPDVEKTVTMAVLRPTLDCTLSWGSRLGSEY